MKDEKQKLGHEPAFPDALLEFDEDNNANVKEHHAGMSKRFYAACAAMQGICVNAGRNGKTFGNPFEIVRTAYSIADELLKQENGTTDK